MAKKLRFTINDGDAFPIPLLASAVRFGKGTFPLNISLGAFVWGVHLTDEHPWKVDITLLQQEQVLPVDDTLCFRHLGHALLVQKGRGDNQTLWFADIAGFPPAINIFYGMRETILRDGNQVFIYPNDKGAELRIKLPTLNVYFRVSKMWKAEVIG